ncbi:MAG: hypothetical protein HY048_11385 [Acidobacteria bacterium]|nr:hypothetical protein [Acidobacteriota bacterium]
MVRFRRLLSYGVLGAATVSVVSSGVLRAPLAAPQAGRPLDDRALWAKVSANWQSLESARRLKYVRDAPITAVPAPLAPVHASVASALHVYNRQLGIYSPRLTLDDDTLEAEVRVLATRFEAGGDKFDSGQIGKALLESEADTQKKYDELLRDAPELSPVGYTAYLVSRYVKEPDDSARVADGVNRLLMTYGFQGSAKLVDTTSFDAVKQRLDAGDIPVTVGKGRSEMIAGYLLDESGNYLIVHDSKRAADTRAAATALMVPSDRRNPGEWAKKLETYLASQGELKEDTIVSLDSKELPSGVAFVPARELENVRVVSIARPSRDLGSLKTIILRNRPRTVSQ